MNLEKLYNKLEELTNKARELNAKDGVTAEEVENVANEIKAVKAKISLQEQLEKEELANKAQKGEAKPVENKEMSKAEDIAATNEYNDAFYKALKNKALTSDELGMLEKVNNALSSQTGEDGGYLIPVDQRTAIKELKREFTALEPLVNVETVSTLTGTRNIEKDAEFTPFVEFAEGDDVPDVDGPQFVNIQYAVKDRGGILPIPNHLLKDNTAGLRNYLNRWLAKKEVATRNYLIINLLQTLPKTAISGIDDIKNILNVTLDPSIARMSVVIMNQDSFNLFDKMKDSDGNYLLQKDPQNPTRKLLAGKTIHVFSNKILPSTETAAPVIIGSLKEAVTLFDRQAMSLLATSVGGDAFKKNRTDIRAITREDVQFVDTDAIVYGEIAL